MLSFSDFLITDLVERVSYIEMDLHVVAIRKEIIIFISFVNDMGMNVHGTFITVNKQSTVFPKTH